MKRSRFFSSLILAGILSLACCQACENGSNESDDRRLPSDREMGGLRGSVISYTLEQANIALSAGNASGKRTFIGQVTYDEGGNQIEMMTPGPDGAPGKPSTLEYEYGENGNIVHSTRRDATGMTVWDLTYQYKYSDQKIERYAYTAGSVLFGKLIFLHGKGGHVVSSNSVSYAPDGSIHSQVTIQYDGNERRTESRMYYGDVLTSTSTYTYDERGEETEFSSSFFSNDGETVTKRGYSGYEYDKQGNWTTRLVVVESPAQGETVGETRHAEYRTITYYPG